VFLHRLEVTILVKQLVTILDAESADDDIGGLADRNTVTSQPTVVACGE